MINFWKPIPFELYSFQEEALLAWFASEAGVADRRADGDGENADRRGGGV